MYTPKLKANEKCLRSILVVIKYIYRKIVFFCIHIGLISQALQENASIVLQAILSEVII